MPFVGAVKNRAFNEPFSALALITDSAYGAFHLNRQEDGSVGLDTHYTRDPERRRLDIRLVVLSEQNYVGVARAYRNKIIIDRNHVTLRQKMRDKPAIEAALGSAFFLVNRRGLADTLSNLEVERRVPVFSRDALSDTEIAQVSSALSAMVFTTSTEEKNDLWTSQQEEIEDWQKRTPDGSLTGLLGKVDWSGIIVDLWFPRFSRKSYGVSVPLQSVVYHDSVISPASMTSKHSLRLLRGLMRVSPPLYVATTRSLDPARSSSAEKRHEQIRRSYAVLAPLHQLSFAAFLSEHRFLTPDFAVEEARYTNGAYILINQNETETYETEQVTLPPLGFYVRHPQMVAHDALRVGEEQFSLRAYRVVRSRDGKPLTESADVLRQEFLV